MTARREAMASFHFDRRAMRERWSKVRAGVMAESWKASAMEVLRV